MPIQVIIAAAAVSVSIPILWWSLASDRGRQDVLKVGPSNKESVSDARSLLMEESASTRVMVPAIRSAGSMLLRLTPVGWMSSLRRNLMLGGHYGDSYVLERTLVLKVMLAIAGFLLSFFAFSGFPEYQRLAFVILFTGTGFLIPDAVVARRGRHRQEQIQLEMPDTLDQLAMSVEAGLGFEAALTRTASAGVGPLAEELNRTLREIQLGIQRDQALRHLADRTDVPDLSSFVLAVVQSGKYGIGIGQVLRVQADEVRDKRRQRAEEKALKIPVLLIFPLAFCIFPTIFIVILGPAAIRIFRDLSPNL